MLYTVLRCMPIPWDWYDLDAFLVSWGDISNSSSQMTQTNYELPLP